MYINIVPEISTKPFLIILEDDQNKVDSSDKEKIEVKNLDSNTNKEKKMGLSTEALKEMILKEIALLVADKKCFTAYDITTKIRYYIKSEVSHSLVKKIVEDYDLQLVSWGYGVCPIFISEVNSMVDIYSYNEDGSKLSENRAEEYAKEIQNKIKGKSSDNQVSNVSNSLTDHETKLEEKIDQLLDLLEAFSDWADNMISSNIKDMPAYLDELSELNKEYEELSKVN